MFVMNTKIINLDEVSKNYSKFYQLPEDIGGKKS